MKQAIIRKHGVRAALFFALCAGALALAHPSSAQTGPVVSVDAVPDASNTATGIGTVDTCRSASTGATFTTDVLIQSVSGITGLEGHLLYNPAVLRVTAVGYAYLIGSNGGGLVELGDVVPDSDGDFELGVVTFPLIPASGSGVLVRLTFQAVGPGSSTLDLQGTKLSDAVGAPIPPADSVTGIFTGSVNDASTAIGGACTDSDGDGYGGVAESGTPLCGDSRNEDNGDDAIIDDGCPGGPAQAGTYSEAQFKIGTGALDPCGTDGWASDFASGGIPDSTNRVTITDLTSFLAPSRRLDTSPGHSNFNSRWDLVPGRGLFATWIAINDLTALIAGPSGFPPMLGGAKAFGGPPCPSPP